MTSLVHDLQQKTLSQEASTADLLRLSLVIAQKLNVIDIREWLESELNGYRDNQEFPEYRCLKGQIKAFNPYRGWIPLQFENPKMEIALTRCIINQPVGQIEYSLNNIQEDDCFQFPLSEAIKIKLRKNMRVDFDIKVFLSPIQAQGIVEAVRNNILKWSLELEKQGIIGENMNFTPEEKSKSHTINIGSITNFSGNLGNEGEITFKQTNLNSEFNIDKLNILLEQIEQNAPRVNLNEEELNKIAQNISSIKNELESSKPKVNVINSSLDYLKTMFNNITGNLIASGIVNEISKLFPLQVS